MRDLLRGIWTAISRRRQQRRQQREQVASQRRDDEIGHARAGIKYPWGGA